MSAATNKSHAQRSLAVILADADLAGRVEAFLDCEREYIDNCLRPLSELEKRLKVHVAQDKAILTEIEISEVFLDATAIFDFTNGMLDKLNRARWGGIDEFMFQFPVIVDKLIPFFKLYQSFVQKSKKAITRCTELIQNNKMYKEFLSLNEAVYGKSILALLSTPMNHFPLYLQYFVVISGGLPPNDPAALGIEATAMKIIDITNYISLSCQRITSREKVVDIQEHVFKSNVALLDPSRGLIREGVCRLVGPKSSPEHMFYLFTDFICWVDKGVFSTSIGGMMQMGGVRIVPALSETSGAKSSFKIKSAITNTEWWISCDTDKARDRWVEDICRAVSEYYSLNDKSSAGVVPSTQMLHPDEFEKKIRKKRFDESKQIKRPAPEFPQGFSATGEKVTGPRPPTKPKNPSPSPTGTAPATPSSTPSRPAPPRPPRTPSSSSAPVESEPEKPYVFDASLTPEVIADWERLVDPTSGRFYYENVPMQITQWDPPQEFLDWRPARPTRVAPVPEDDVPEDDVRQPAAPVPTFFPTPTPTTAPATPSQPLPPAQPTPPTPPTHATPPVLPPSFPASSPSGAPPALPPSLPSGPPAMPPSTGGEPPSKPVSPFMAAGGAGLLSAIRGGAQLKPASADPSPAASPSNAAGGGGFLASIQNRPQLRKVSASDVPAKPVPQSSGGGINDALQKSLANYRKFVQDEEDDDEDDDEW